MNKASSHESLEDDATKFRIEALQACFESSCYNRPFDSLQTENVKLQTTNARLRVALDEAMRREKEVIAARGVPSIGDTLTVQQLQTEREKLRLKVNEQTELNTRLRSEVLALHERWANPTADDVAVARQALESVGMEKLPVSPDGSMPDQSAVITVTIARLQKDRNRLQDLVDMLQSKVVHLTNQKVTF